MKNTKSLNSKNKGKALAESLNFLKSQWGWSNSDLSEVTRIPISTINNWTTKKFIPIKDKPSIQAIIHLIAIHKTLDSMFEQPKQQLQWLTTNHPDFNEPPIEYMKKSLIGVSQYLDKELNKV